MPSVVIALLLIFFTASPALNQETGDVAKVQVLGSTAEPAESLAEMPDGSILITQNRSGYLRRLTTDGKVEDFVKLPMHPVGIVAIKDGYVITADNRQPPAPGTPAPQNPYADVGTEAVQLDAKGSVVKRFPGAPGQFFNGLTQAGNIFLIADTIGGTIWRLDLKKGIEPWLTNDELLPAPGRPIPGANGIREHDGWVYISNSTRGKMLRIAIDHDGKPKGSLETFVPLTGLDDFGVTKDGLIYAPSGMSLVKITPAGQVTKFLDPIQNAAFALVTRDQKWLYFGTRGPMPGAPPLAPGQAAMFLMEKYPLK